MSEAPEIEVTALSDDARVLDVREPNEWSAGHTSGAVHIPMRDVPGRLTELAELVEGTDGALPVICRSGNRSGQVVAWLTQQGYDVTNVAGGMKAWQQAGKPMVSESGQPPAVA